MTIHAHFTYFLNGCLCMVMSLQKIKDVLFSDEETKAQFVERANNHIPPIPGNNFDEKLHHLFHANNELNIQLLLAPFLREKVFKYLDSEHTVYAQSQKQDYIIFNGSYAYNDACNGAQETFEDLDFETNARLRQDSSNDFHQFKTSFIHNRGQLAWNKMLQAANTKTTSEDFDQFKAEFIQACAEIPTDEEIDSRQLWNRIYACSEATQDFDQLKKHYIEAWSEEQWNTYNVSNIVPVAPRPAENPLEDEPDLPTPLTAEESFAKKRTEFLQKHGAEAWQRAQAESAVPALFLHKAQELKQQFITQQGWKDWWRIHRPPNYVAAFDAMKQSFIAKFDQETWNHLVNLNDADLVTSVDSSVLQDFKERKKQFTDKCKNIPNAWEQAKAYSPLPQDALLEIEEYKKEFIEHWGSVAWNEYINTHRRDRVYAKEVQLKVLAELFDLQMDVTTINNGTQQTTQHLSDQGAYSIHLYCQDFIHYFVHEHGYHDTEPDGNCAYNAIAQWLLYLVLGLSPRRSIVLPVNDEHHSTSYALVQSALNQSDKEIIIDPEVQHILSHEEITLLSIHKELDLSYTFASTAQFSEFLLAKIQDLIKITRARKLPYNRVPLLEKIAKLVKKFDKQGNREALETLQKILAGLANTLYIPHTQGVSPQWTDECFKNNIQTLKTSMVNELSEKTFADLAHCITNTDFFNFSKESTLTSFFAPRTRLSTITSYSHLTYRSALNSATPPEEEDWLSATMCISGIFLLITGLACFSGLILASLISGTGYLGLYLMNLGLQTIATTLAGIIGLSAANTAILVATTGATMISGLGICLFKDFAPPSMLAHSPILSMAPF